MQNVGRQEIRIASGFCTAARRGRIRQGSSTLSLMLSTQPMYTVLMMLPKIDFSPVSAPVWRAFARLSYRPAIQLFCLLCPKLTWRMIVSSSWFVMPTFLLCCYRCALDSPGLKAMGNPETGAVPLVFLWRVLILDPPFMIGHCPGVPMHRCMQSSALQHHVVASGFQGDPTWPSICLEASKLL